MKPGDKVRCINAKDSYENYFLTHGEIYTIVRNDGPFVLIEESPAAWFTDRFEPISDNKYLELFM